MRLPTVPIGVTPRGGEKMRHCYATTHVRLPKLVAVFGLIDEIQWNAITYALFFHCKLTLPDTTGVGVKKQKIPRVFRFMKFKPTLFRNPFELEVVPVNRITSLK